MDDTEAERAQFLNLSAGLEGGLAVLAFGLAWLTGLDLWAASSASLRPWLVGLLAVAPLWLLFLMLDRLPFESLQEIRQFVIGTLGPSLVACHWFDLLLLSALVGLSEEVLFRGVLQAGAVWAWGWPAAIIITNALFGALHAVTWLYAILAGLLGVYMSLVMSWGASGDLVAPIVTHAVYDFLGFLQVRRWYHMAQRELAIPDTAAP